MFPALRCFRILPGVVFYLYFLSLATYTLGVVADFIFIAVSAGCVCGGLFFYGACMFSREVRDEGYDISVSYGIIVGGCGMLLFFVSGLFKIVLVASCDYVFPMCDCSTCYFWCGFAMGYFWSWVGIRNFRGGHSTGRDGFGFKGVKNLCV